MSSKEYHREYSKTYYKNLKETNPTKLKAIRDERTRSRNAHKAFWVDRFGGVCHFCKEAFPACVFDFHHLDPSVKDTVIAKLLHFNSSRVEQEMSKCIMLCANCHRKEHARLHNEQKGTV